VLLPGGNMSRKAIVCVDDESIILWSMVQEISEHFGERFEYHSMTDPKKVVSLLRSLESSGVETSLVVSDWLMPGLKGDELVNLLAQDNPGIRAVIVTGHSNDNVLSGFRSNPNIFGIVAKPWVPEHLMSVIEKAMLR
jgi:DNA-binding NtrC family response regulator